MSQFDRSVTAEDLFEFLEMLQDDQDDLLDAWKGTVSLLERYELMEDICDNAWQQQQARQWIRIVNQSNLPDYVLHRAD